MRSKTKTRKRFEHIDEIPEFAETQTQLAELVATKKRALETLTNLAPMLQMSAADAAVESEAARLLGDAGNKDAAAQLHMREQVEAAQLTADAATIAIKKQQTQHEEARRRAETIICEQRQPEHQELASDIGHALKLLRDALRDEREFRNELDRAGAQFKAPLCPVAMPRVGTAEDSYAPIANWFAQCQYKLDVELND